MLPGSTQGQRVAGAMTPRSIETSRCQEWTAAHKLTARPLRTKTQSDLL